jgi:uncharacterized protein
MIKRQRWLLSQRWDDLLFAHWPVDADVLRPLLPRGVELDELNGSAWVGVVAFRMTETRAGGLLPTRGLGPIPELNLRTYVNVQGERGVWFLSLDTSSPLFITIGRALYGLAYHRAQMIVTRDGTRFHYASVRGATTFVASCEPIGGSRPATLGSLEHWLLERYRLYALRGGQLVTACVEHAPWVLQDVAVRLHANTLAPASLGLAGEPVAHFSPGVAALISPPTPVRLQSEDGALTELVRQAVVSHAQASS